MAAVATMPELPGRKPHGDTPRRGAGLPTMVRNGLGFWVSLAAGCVLTVALYGLMVWAGPRFGLKM